MVRTALSPAEVDEFWRRWRSGQTVKVLARQMRPTHAETLDSNDTGRALAWLADCGT